jgi:hypothetical protein
MRRALAAKAHGMPGSQHADRARRLGDHNVIVAMQVDVQAKRSRAVIDVASPT